MIVGKVHIHCRYLQGPRRPIVLEDLMNVPRPYRVELIQSDYGMWTETRTPLMVSADFQSSGVAYG